MLWKKYHLCYLLLFLEIKNNKKLQIQKGGFMKKVLLVLFAAIIIVFTIGCQNPVPIAEPNEYDSLKTKMGEKEVKLAFFEFELGKPINDCLLKAKKNKEIEITKINKGKDLSVEFRCKLTDKIVDCKVCSFEDTITSLVILSEDPSIQGIDNLYIEKYGEPLKSYLEVDEKNENSYDFKWLFKNSSIYIYTHYKSEDKIAVIKGREGLRSDNRLKYETVQDIYFVMLSITYNDLYQMKKVKKIKEIEKKRKDLINNAKVMKDIEAREMNEKTIKEKTIKSI